MDQTHVNFKTALKRKFPTTDTTTELTTFDIAFIFYILLCLYFLLQLFGQ